mmetsp:Transcript_15738/g.24197  ORF Transcript_15738/g.24197 Transcript_15738/m.24197 type:complete len:89 (-) Transcript_15738:297-563(-)
MAVCNIVYQDDIAAAIKARMPADTQHIYLMNDEAQEGIKVSQILNMTNFMPLQTRDGKASPEGEVHLNFNVELPNVPMEEANSAHLKE